jgi:hypothetical protein
MKAVQSDLFFFTILLLSSFGYTIEHFYDLDKHMLSPSIQSKSYVFIILIFSTLLLSFI